jgi:glyoxylase-like metal-dependent hydrolase (beta-lactamase superfamily II)
MAPFPSMRLIDTHYDGDHVAGNVAFHKDGTTIVAHDNIRVRLPRTETGYRLLGNAPRAYE